MLSIISSQENDKGIIKLEGVLDISTIKLFKDSINNMLDVKLLNIDFEKVNFVDSTGIGGLAKALIMLEENNIKVSIINLSEEVYEVFNILGLWELFGKELFNLKK